MELSGESIFVERNPKETIVTFMDSNILHPEQVQQLKESIMGLLEQAWTEKFILDFCHVRCLSSSVLGLLLVIHKKINEEKGKLQLQNISPEVYEVFTVTNMTKIFDIKWP